MNQNSKYISRYSEKEYFENPSTESKYLQKI